MYVYCLKCCVAAKPHQIITSVMLLISKNEYSCSRGASCGFISFNSEIFVSGERHMEFCVPELQAIKWVKDVTVRDGVITLACDYEGVKQFRLV